MTHVPRKVGTSLRHSGRYVGGLKTILNNVSQDGESQLRQLHHLLLAEPLGKESSLAARVEKLFGMWTYQRLANRSGADAQMIGERRYEDLFTRMKSVFD